MRGKLKMNEKKGELSSVGLRKKEGEERRREIQEERRRQQR